MEPLTHSILSTGLLCPKRMYWKYERMFSERTTEALLIGQAFHLGLQHRDPVPAVELVQAQEYNSQEEYDRLLITAHIVRGMILGALQHWQLDWKESHRELKFELPLRNPDTDRPSRTFYLAGKMDEIVRDTDNRWWLVEYKTSTQGPNKDLIERLPVDTQLSIYFYAAQEVLDIKISGVLYRLARKPSIRQRMNETVREFGIRVTEDYQERPDFYFHEIMVPRAPEDIKRMRQNLWDLSQLFLFYKRENIWPMNHAACSHWGRICDYLPLCVDEEDAKFMYKRLTTKTPELEE